MSASSMNQNQNNQSEAIVKEPVKDDVNKEVANVCNNSSDSTMNNDLALRNMIQFQVEYHFGDENLNMDNYLLSCMHEDPEFWVPLTTVENLTKIKALTISHELVVESIRNSKMLVLNADATKVKRLDFSPPKPKPHKDLRRTVFLYGLPPNTTKEDVEKICSLYGVVKSVILDTPNNGYEQPKESDTPNNSSELNPLDETEKNTNETIRGNVIKIIVLKLNLHLFFFVLCIVCTFFKLNKNVYKDAQKATTEKLSPPDRETAEAVMRRRFCPQFSQLESPIVLGSTQGELVAPVMETLKPSKSDNKNASALRISVSHVDHTTESTLLPCFAKTVPHSSGNVDMSDFRHLKSAFVVFESQSQANKCVRGRMHANDGICAMHQYDFNKQRKKLCAFRAQELSPLFNKDSRLQALGQKFTFESRSGLLDARQFFHKSAKTPQLQSKTKPPCPVLSARFSRANIDPAGNNNQSRSNKSKNKPMHTFRQRTQPHNNSAYKHSRAKFECDALPKSQSYISPTLQASNNNQQAQSPDSCRAKYYLRSHTAFRSKDNNLQQLPKTMRSDSTQWRNFGNTHQPEKALVLPQPQPIENNNNRITTTPNTNILNVSFEQVRTLLNTSFLRYQGSVEKKTKDKINK
ncbi:hypothetical protein RFI_10240 [Reticulomyxa filosa]|uniref:HTH La-type RNA-binding domain-containing protein n=1 Tax=Reticulomyxa filosa TaxID=46433 RepID=X6NKV0_RETFI|nr:hypothetical protein RFI_10240 [Reticulomyxa filosa]|eukprot:ETO26895.1 hypothetical protein RFI_10240 [Reticulomyxa filosa]